METIDMISTMIQEQINEGEDRIDAIERVFDAMAANLFHDGMSQDEVDSLQRYYEQNLN